MFKVEKTKRANVKMMIRVTDDLYNEIKQVAEEEGVSMNNLIISAIKYAFSHRERKDNK